MYVCSISSELTTSGCSRHHCRVVRCVPQSDWLMIKSVAYSDWPSLHAVLLRSVLSAGQCATTFWMSWHRAVPWHCANVGRLCVTSYTLFSVYVWNDSLTVSHLHLFFLFASLPLPLCHLLSFYISSTASISKSIWRVLVPSWTEGTFFVTATLLIGLNKKTCSWPRNLMHIYIVPLIHVECAFVTYTVLVET